MAWLNTDRLIRDGDEEGHVGAAELFMVQLRGGSVAAFASDAWRGDLGEYPPLYPAVVGAWWTAMGGGQPSRTPIRAINLALLALAAGATGAAAKRTSRRSTEDAGNAAAVAGIAVLLAPLANGLSRHFMPEGALVAAVAGTIFTAVWATERPTTTRAIALGAAVGAGLLVKQTFFIVGLPAALLLGWRLGPRLLISGMVTAAIAAPWYLGHLDDQIAYGARSADAGGTAAGWLHVAYYPAIGAWLVLGPALAAALLAATPAALRSRTGPARPALLALALSGVLLLLIPKKYPRLLAPLTPLAAMVIAGSAAARRRWVWWAAPASVWLVGTSTHQLPELSAVSRLDPRCPQRWLRPAQPDDFGFAAVAARVSSAPPGPIAVHGEREIPCVLQTTPEWSQHLPAYLRRAGVERELTAPDDPGVALHISWSPPKDPIQAEQTDVPALGSTLYTY